MTMDNDIETDDEILRKSKNFVFLQLISAI